MKGIISLTSWKARIDTVYITIENLLKTCPDWHIVLVLSSDEFPKKEAELPETVTKQPIEILWVEKNYKSFKKVAFTLRKYPNLPIVSADDDAFYHTNYADELYDKWIEKGKVPCAINYVDIPQITFLGPCMLYYGINYPVETIDETTINKSLDDVWMWRYCNEHKIPIFTLGKKKAPFSLHDDTKPLHPKFKSKFMQSIQHVETVEPVQKTSSDDQMHLVLIQYKYNNQSKEIVSAVKSFQRHAQFNYEMFIIGDKCPWLDITVIEGDNKKISTPCRAQHIHVARDLKKALTLFKDKYDEFCLMSDDFFCINDFTWQDIATPHYNTIKSGTVFNKNEWTWAHSKVKTLNMLKTKGLPTVSYTTHCFAVYNIEKMLSLIDEYNLTTPPNDYTIEDLYGNIYWNGISKPIDKIRYRVKEISPLPYKFMNAKLEGKLFVNFIQGVNLKALDSIDQL